MILKIRSAGEPVLRARARPLRPEEILLPSTQELIASMRETMHDAPGSRPGRAAGGVAVAARRDRRPRRIYEGP